MLKNFGPLKKFRFPNPAPDPLIQDLLGGTKAYLCLSLFIYLYFYISLYKVYIYVYSAF